MEQICLICTEPSTIDNPCILVHTNIKTCKCKYYVHNRCFKTWLSHNEVCLVCRTHTLHNNNNYDISADLFYTSHTMNAVGSWISNVFSYVLYPFAIIGTFVLSLIFYTYIIIITSVGIFAYCFQKN
jgi:hypothetical protein